jgi:hypothetical protein
MVDMEWTAEAIWWEQPEILWLREQGLEPSLRMTYESGSRPGSEPIGFDEDGHYDMSDFDHRTRIYTITFDVPEHIRTLMLLKWPLSQRRIDF